MATSVPYRDAPKSLRMSIIKALRRKMAAFQGRALATSLATWVDVFDRCEPTLELAHEASHFDRTEVTRLLNQYYRLLLRKPGRYVENPPYPIYSDDAQYLAHKVLAVTRSSEQVLLDIVGLPLPEAFNLLRQHAVYWSVQNSVAEAIHFAYSTTNPY